MRGTDYRPRPPRVQEGPRRTPSLTSSRPETCTSLTLQPEEEIHETTGGKEERIRVRFELQERSYMIRT